MIIFWELWYKNCAGRAEHQLLFVLNVADTFRVS